MERTLPLTVVLLPKKDTETFLCAAIRIHKRKCGMREGAKSLSGGAQCTIKQGDLSQAQGFFFPSIVKKKKRICGQRYLAILYT